MGDVVMSQVTRFDEPAELGLTADEIDMLILRGAGRVVIERHASGGVTAIGIVMRRGEAPDNTLLFRISRPARSALGQDGETLSLPPPVLEHVSTERRRFFLNRIAERVAERHEILPRQDNEPEDAL